MRCSLAWYLLLCAAIACAKPLRIASRDGSVQDALSRYLAPFDILTTY